ncbi:MAG TPA: hypothetical protein VIV11_26145 [Kofleriaceae bacterium]
MSRSLIAFVGVVVTTGVAHAQDVPEVTPPSTATPADSGVATNANAPSDMGDQGIAAMLGVAGGGRSTPGGLLVAGHYYYQLSDQDWFDGSAAFVFGSGDAECFRDRMNVTLCEHGLASGYAGKLGVAARRFMPNLATETFWPFVRAGLGTALVRFPDDDITGITFSVQVGAGLRASLTEAIALTAEADLELGVGQFSNGLGGEPQLGVNISAGAEFKL